MSVLKDFWNNGAGTLLMNQFLDWTRQKGVKKIQLEVLDHNLRAINFYKKFGFKMEGRKTKNILLKDGYHDLLVMGLEMRENI